MGPDTPVDLPAVPKKDPGMMRRSVFFFEIHPDFLDAVDGSEVPFPTTWNGAKAS